MAISSQYIIVGRHSGLMAIALYSQCLSTQVYKRVLANLLLGVTLQWPSIPSTGE